MEPSAAITKALEVLATRASITALPRAYYKGDHRTKLHSKDFTNPHRTVIEGIRDNQCRKVIEVVVDRLRITGFTPDDPNAAVFAARAWDLWQASRMDLRLDEWFRGSEICGEPAAIIVDVDDDGAVRFYPQQPEQVWIDPDPVDPARARTAVKLWRGGDGVPRATVYTDGDQHYVYRGTTPVNADPLTGELPKATEGAGQRYTLEAEVPNALPGVCPVFAADITYTDLTDVIPLQDLLNAELQREAVSGEYYSFGLRVFLGLEMEIDPETGQKVPPFDVSANRAVFLPTGYDGQRPEVRDLPGQDPAPFLAAAAAHRLAIASSTSTPAYLLAGGTDYPSGAARRTAEAPFIAKIQSRQTVYGAAIAAAAAYAVRLDGLAAGLDADVPGLTVQWARADVTEERDAAATVADLAALGVPLSYLLPRYLGWSQEEADAAQAAADVAAAERRTGAADLGLLG